MKTEWHGVKRFEDRYEVNRAGEIRNKTTGKILKGCVNSRGYLNVSLYFEGGRATVSVHRAVAEAFLPNKKGLPFVNHRDLDKTHNAARNLEWVTEKENSEHAVDNGVMPRGEKNGNSKLTKNDIFHIREMLGAGYTKACIARTHGISRKLVLNIANEKTWKHV